MHAYDFIRKILYFCILIFNLFALFLNYTILLFHNSLIFFSFSFSLSHGWWSAILRSVWWKWVFNNWILEDNFFFHGFDSFSFAVYSFWTWRKCFFIINFFYRCFYRSCLHFRVFTRHSKLRISTFQSFTRTLVWRSLPFTSSRWLASSSFLCRIDIFSICIWTLVNSNSFSFSNFL